MLTDPPLLSIKRTWKRVDRRVLDALAGVQTGHLVDAMRGRGGLDAVELLLVVHVVRGG